MITKAKPAPPPFLLPGLPGAVLIDNSTYFSAKAVLDQTAFDADSIHNLALFLESLVFAENLFTSPTLAWRPDASDELFLDGICQQVRLETLSVAQQRALYLNAIAEAIHDAGARAEFEGVQLTPAFRGAAIKRLTEWQALADRKPEQFATVYSDAVFIADRATRDKIRRLRTRVTERTPPDRQVAQYLLRTNVAIQFSTAYAYLPHSHRARLVASKLQRRSLAQREAFTLLRDAETIIRSSQRKRLQSGLLRHLPPYQSAGVSIPLVFAAVLLDSRTPADLVANALAIRKWSSARKYRQFARDLIRAIRETAPTKDVERLDARVEQSRKLLARELQKLFGPRDDTPLTSTVRVLGAVKLAVDFRLGDAYTELTTAAPWLAEKLHIFDPRFRHVAVLTRLARKRKQLVDLNKHLERVFRKRLSDDQLQRFSELSEKT